MTSDTPTAHAPEETETRPQSLREFLDRAPSKAFHAQVLEGYRRHGISLDSPWPPQFPEEGAPEPPQAEQKGQWILFPQGGCLITCTGPTLLTSLVPSEKPKPFALKTPLTQHWRGFEGERRA
jgi:hypothetical protein